VNSAFGPETLATVPRERRDPERTEVDRRVQFDAGCAGRRRLPQREQRDVGVEERADTQRAVEQRSVPLISEGRRPTA
jgi:hypothetical protein